jgi:hypothetical protein
MRNDPLFLTLSLLHSVLVAMAILPIAGCSRLRLILTGIIPTFTLEN